MEKEKRLRKHKTRDRKHKDKQIEDATTSTDVNCNCDDSSPRKKFIQEYYSIDTLPFIRCTCGKVFNMELYDKFIKKISKGYTMDKGFEYIGLKRICCKINFRHIPRILPVQLKQNVLISYNQIQENKTVVISQDNKSSDIKSSFIAR